MGRPKINERLRRNCIGIRIPMWIFESMKDSGSVQKHIDTWLQEGIGGAESWLLPLIARFA